MKTNYLPKQYSRNALKAKASQAYISICANAFCECTAALLYGYKLAGVEIDPAVPLLYLCISHCNVETLNFATDLPLLHLAISHAPLFELDTAHMPCLYFLELHSVKLRQLYTEPLHSLKALKIYWTPIGFLDVTSILSVTHLELLTTDITAFDVSLLRNLQILRVQANYVSGIANCLPELRKLSIHAGKVEEIILYSCYKLEKIEVRSDFPAKLYLASIPALRFVLVRRAAIDWLNTAYMQLLKQLDVAWTRIAHLDTRRLSELEKLLISGTYIKYLDISVLTKLKLLEASGTHVARLAIRNLKILKAISIPGTFVRFADFKDNKRIRIVSYQKYYLVAARGNLITWSYD